MQSRIELMDIGRGFAILGILWLNIFVFAMPFATLSIPGLWGEYNLPNLLTWIFTGIFVDGVMRAMISILFGASALLMLTRAEQHANGFAGLDRYFRRLLMLILIGFVHSYVLLWPYDILYLYGIFGLLIFPFRNLPPSRLLIIAGTMVFLSVLIGSEGASPMKDALSKIESSLSEKELQNLEQADPLIENFDDIPPDWSIDDQIVNSIGDRATDTDEEQVLDLSSDDAEVVKLMAQIEEEIILRRMDYLTIVRNLATLSFEEQTVQVFEQHFLDVFPMMLLGMALLKLGFLGGALKAGIYLRVTLFAFCIGCLLGSMAHVPVGAGTLWATLSERVSEYAYDPRRISLALAYFGTLALLMKSGWFSGILDCLTACGRMALTLYVGQTVICNFLFMGFGFGLFGQFEHFEILMIGVALTLFQLIIVPIYFRFFRQGPMEALLRNLIRTQSDVRTTEETKPTIGGKIRPDASA